MIKVYEILPNGRPGRTAEIDPRKGVREGWTYTPPPDGGDYVWESGGWVPFSGPASAPLLPNLEYLGGVIRQERNARIAATDWTQGKDIQDYISAAWAPYRQALRDITSQPDFPLSVQWPEEPVVAKPEPAPEPVVPAEETIDNTATETPPEVL